MPCALCGRVSFADTLTTEDTEDFTEATEGLL